MLRQSQDASVFQPQAVLCRRTAGQVDNKTEPLQQPTGAVISLLKNYSGLSSTRMPADYRLPVRPNLRPLDISWTFHFKLNRACQLHLPRCERSKGDGEEPRQILAAVRLGSRCCGVTSASVVPGPSGRSLIKDSDCASESVLAAVESHRRPSFPQVGTPGPI